MIVPVPTTGVDVLAGYFVSRDEKLTLKRLRLWKKGPRYELLPQRVLPVGIDFLDLRQLGKIGNPMNPAGQSRSCTQPPFGPCLLMDRLSEGQLKYPTACDVFRLGAAVVQDSKIIAPRFG